MRLLKQLLLFGSGLNPPPNYSPRELLDKTSQPLNPTTVGMRDVNDDEG